MPGDILDCRVLECFVRDIVNNTTTDSIWADYEYIASLGYPFIDSNPQDVDEDGDDDIYFGPQSFVPSHTHQVLGVNFYLENPIPRYADIHFRALDDNLDIMIEEILPYTGVSEDEERRFAVGNAFPNPFHRSTSIEYNVPLKGKVSIKIYDICGKFIKELVNRTQIPGKHNVEWDGTNDEGNRLPSGIYFCSIENGKYKETKKLIMVK